jgi:hypothetical protein
MAYDWDAHNYDRDSRVVNAREQAEFNSGFDVRSMTFTFQVDNGEEEEEPKSYVLPAKYEVCPTCNGRGSHVRPSVDAGGYNFDDDDYDPETGESVYWSGMYDQTCETCHGRTTVPVIDRDRADKATLAIWDERCEEDADYERICRMERMMGC